MTATDAADRPQTGLPLAAAIDAWIGAQGTRLALWLPVMLGIGIGCYFALPEEPRWWLGLALSMALLTLILLVWTVSLTARTLALAAITAALGFTAAQWQTHRVDAPQLDSPVGPAMVTGRVVSRDTSDGGVRVVLDELAIEGLDDTIAPDQVRIRLTTRSLPPAIGSRISLRAVLNLPGDPVLPGGFDFRRYAFFRELGAFGYAVSRPTVLAPPEGGGLALWMERFRHGIADRIDAQIMDGRMSERAGSVSVVLLTGDRSAISDELYSDMRRSGLAHLLAISGLHVGLIAGLVFFFTRAALALFPTLVLHYPIKKWAALAAILSAFSYMLLVGATVPTQRAFLMAGLVFFAVIVDRRAISLRLVALAAVVVLLIAPASLTGPSFQMSFAAVLALVALYDGLRDRWADWRVRAGLSRRVGLYLVSLMITSLTATLATAPFVLYHFQETPVYGPLANLIAVPLTAMWIMPWGLAAYLLMPFGLEGLALTPMGWGIDGMLDLAHWCANLPGAVLFTPALSDLAIILAIAGGLWLALWRGTARWFGLAGFAAASVVAHLTPVPTILVSEDASLMGITRPDGSLAVSQTRRDSFTREQWARLVGASTVISWDELSDADPAFRCDGAGCVWQIDGRQIGFVFDPAILEEDCAISDIVVTQVPARGLCTAPIVVDRFDVWRNGAYAIVMPVGADLTRDQFLSRTDIRTVSAQTGNRPWSRTVP